MSSGADEPGIAVYPPELFLEPWTRRRLRRVTERRENLASLLARVDRQRRVTTALDPVVTRHLAETAEAWTHDTVDVAPHLAVEDVHAIASAALQAGYLFGRLLVDTADVDQQWSDEGDREELHGWLSQVVPMIDWSALGGLMGASAHVTDTVAAVAGELLHEHGLAGDAEAAIRARVFTENGLCVALVEHSATRPLAEHVWVDLTVLGDVLPADTLERVWIGEALGCLLARVDRRGRCSEAALRDAADELGGERGHRYFRQLRGWGVIDYGLTPRGTSTVRVPRHRELRGGPLAG